MTSNLVEPALRATYHLAGSDAQRLRRLTRQSGLEAENVLSRLAIVHSLSLGRNGTHADYEPSKAGRVKEIKGGVLLGRPRQAALLLALLAKCHGEEFADPKAAITWHWARGLKVLEESSEGGDVLHSLAERLASQKTSDSAATVRARRSGLGNSARDEIAAAVGRRFPRWSTEVCRLVAMAARLDPRRLDTVAERLDAEVRKRQGTRPMNEAAALRVLQDQWGVNRLGLTAADRDTFGRVLAGEAVAAELPSIPFLIALGLVAINGDTPRLTVVGRRLGEEAIHP